MKIENGDVFWSDTEKASCLVLYSDTSFDWGTEYKVVYVSKNSDTLTFYRMTWIPENLLRSQWKRAGHIDISLLTELARNH